MIYSMPLNFTFMFVFYTETLAMTSVLILYYRTITIKHTFIGSLLNLALGLLALSVRQTNIMWLNYLALVHVIKREKFKGVWELLRYCVRNILTLIIYYWWIVVLDIMFIVFLYWNNWSIVLGHQEHHSMSLHLSQICYLMLFTALFPIISLHELKANYT